MCTVTLWDAAMWDPAGGEMLEAGVWLDGCSRGSRRKTQSRENVVMYSGLSP